MFTGIIQATARIKEFSKEDQSAHLCVEKPTAWETVLGDSIAIQGTCLTIVAQDDKTFSFDIMAATLDKTTFGARILEKVNLERAVTLENKLDGHMVSGHVDDRGTVVSLYTDGEYRLRISFDKKYSALVVPKGSITIDGVSLTVGALGDDWCEVSLVPYTLEHTTLGKLAVGWAVNLEFDMIGKYIHRYMETHYAGK